MWHHSRSNNNETSKNWEDKSESTTWHTTFTIATQVPNVLTKLSWNSIDICTTKTCLSTTNPLRVNCSQGVNFRALALIFTILAAVLAAVRSPQSKLHPTTSSHASQPLQHRALVIWNLYRKNNTLPLMNYAWKRHLKLDCQWAQGWAPRILWHAPSLFFKSISCLQFLYTAMQICNIMEYWMHEPNRFHACASTAVLFLWFLKKVLNSKVNSPV